MKWIHVKQQMPEIGQEILVYAKLDEILSFKGIDKFQGTLNPSVSHWMPIYNPEESNDMD